MAASFIGWLRATCLAESSPVVKVKSETINPKLAATIIERLANCISRFLSRYQLLIAITKREAKT